jgi:YHS domain-containing protein
MNGKEAMEIDPICGMEVDPAKPPGGTSDFQGTTYYFCNAGCKRTFDKEPAKHVPVT